MFCIIGLIGVGDLEQFWPSTKPRFAHLSNCPRDLMLTTLRREMIRDIWSRISPRTRLLLVGKFAVNSPFTQSGLG